MRSGVTVYTTYAPQAVGNVQHKVHETNPLPLEVCQTASALLCNSGLTGCSGSIGSPSQNVPLLLSVLRHPVF
jgi:hypothetical protein